MTEELRWFLKKVPGPLEKFLLCQWAIDILTPSDKANSIHKSHLPTHTIQETSIFQCPLQFSQGHSSPVFLPIYDICHTSLFFLFIITTSFGDCAACHQSHRDQSLWNSNFSVEGPSQKPALVLKFFLKSEGWQLYEKYYIFRLIYCFLIPKSLCCTTCSFYMHMMSFKT